MDGIRIEDGRSWPLGPTPTPTGVNLSVRVAGARWVEVVVFREPEASSPSHVFRLDAARHRTGSFWHAHLVGLGVDNAYGYTAGGPGLDPAKLLVDPYARALVIPDAYDREAARGPGSTIATGLRSAVTAEDGYDWEGDRPPRRPWSETVIYEMHVKGFTAHPTSGVAPAVRGTYAGLVEKIPYLVDLGITAVELLPVQAFDPQDAPQGLTNYWGYAPVSWFAPHPAWAAATRPGAVLDEFRDMVKALHRAGIEVLLDVVYNHTAEHDETGPTHGYRGLDDAAYYLRDPERGGYLDVTGCGNTVHANHAVTRRLILDSLRYWVEVMHVDGFRFDLASALTRGEGGAVLDRPPLIEAVDADPVLAGTKRIAEAWDATGLHHVGRFPGQDWGEWNGPFRDDVRRFLRGDDGSVPALTTRLFGGAERNVDFVTCHDGFTLNDLVSYEEKHNEANHAQADSGSDLNFSTNHGVEGPTDDAHIEATRNRQVKNALALVLLAGETPMLLMGDEVRRTQHGNNNAYCQDNDLSYLDWSFLKRHADVRRFTRRLLALRRGLRCHTWDRVRWRGLEGDEPDLGDEAHAIACDLEQGEEGSRLLLLLNAGAEPLSFALPTLGEGVWHRVLDTARLSPDDVCEPATPAPWNEASCEAAPRSVVLLAGRLEAEAIP